MYLLGYLIGIVGGRLAARAASKTRAGRWFHDVMNDPWRPAREHEKGRCE
jgi:hypothetical protein